MPFKVTRKALEAKAHVDKYPLALWYAKYLASDYWKGIREALFAARGRRCEICRSTEKLVIHHLTYVRVCNEKITDLQILCEHCHRRIPHHIVPYIDRIYNPDYAGAAAKKWK